MNKENLSSVALLSNDGDMTSFRYGNNNIRFRSPKCLKRYTEVKEWDKGILLLWQIMKVWAKRKSIHPPYHALVMTSEGEITETNMNDIEISIVQKYWIRNKKLMEQAYA